MIRDPITVARMKVRRGVRNRGRNGTRCVHVSYSRGQLKRLQKHERERAHFNKRELRLRGEAEIKAV